MSKTLKKVAVLLLVFIAAAVVYFLWPMRSEKETDIEYTAMKDATLPVVYPRMGEREMAPLFGHMEELAATADRDSLLVLPEDRRLSIRIADAGGVSGIRYEIRSMDLSRLVERTELSDWGEADGSILAQLPIQNLLDSETEYQMGICLKLSDGRSIWYYARIIEADNAHVEEMLALADEFSRKTLNYNEAQDLTMYMESTPNADNSTFGNVTLKCSFSQITWGGLNVERAGDVRMTLRELDGNLANIQMDYTVIRQADQETEIFEVSENFTMRWATQRVYMMDYQREMNQLFTGARSLFSGKRITMGISCGRDLYSVSSTDSRFTAFVVNRELWSYDNSENLSTRVFSFGGADSDDLRENNKRHGIEILDVAENGQINFLVYGYMNRGNREGYTGVSMFHYDPDKNALDEQFFIPSAEPFELLKADIERLVHKGQNGILYLMMDGAVYGIDLTSFEYVVVASGLTDDKFAVSADRSRLAWQEDTGVYDSRMLHVMDLDTGERTQIGDGQSKAYRILGFVGSDCIYGIGTPGDYIMSNGRVMGLFLESLEIIDKNMASAMHYEKSGYTIRDVQVDESRIHIYGVRDKSGGFYAPTSEDTLVCNAEAVKSRTDQIGWYASEIKGKVYFVQLSKDVAGSQKMKSTTPKKLATDHAAVLDLHSLKNAEAMEFYAYGRGRFLGKYVAFSDAVNAAYDSMGFVTDEQDRMLWVRGNKVNSYNIRDIAAATRRLERYRGEFTGNRLLEDGNLMLDASGCTLNQILYFVGKGMPVLIYTGEGSFSYITGYDQAHVTVYNPVTGSSEKMELDQAQAYLDGLGNDYVCCVVLN